VSETRKRKKKWTRGVLLRLYAGTSCSKLEKREPEGANSGNKIRTENKNTKAAVEPPWIHRESSDQGFRERRKRKSIR